MDSHFVRIALVAFRRRQRKSSTWPNGSSFVYSKHSAKFLLPLTATLFIVGGQLLFAQQPATAVSNTQQPSPDGLKAQTSEPTILSAGMSIQRELRGGEQQAFVLHLASGQFLHAEVEQRGIDLVLTMHDPTSKKLATIDSPNGQYGPEPMVWEAVAPGRYLLEVRAPNSKAPPGSYVIKVVALRDPTALDKDRVLAARTFQEGQDLRGQRTASSRQAAIEKYKHALSLFAALGDQYWHALTLHAIGSTYAQSGEVRKGLGFFEQALPQVRAAGDKRREAGVLNFIGGLRDVLGDLPVALEHYRQALAIYGEVEDPGTKASVLNNIGKIYYDTADWQKSLDHYNQALAVFHSLGDQRREALALNNIAWVYNALGEPEKTVFYAEQSLQLGRTIGDKVGEADALGTIGHAHVRRGEAQKAFAYYNQALPLRQAIGEPRDEATTRDSIGLAYAALNQPAKALEEHQRALELRRLAGDRRSEALTLGNLAHVYDLLGDPAKALENYKQALAIFRLVEDGEGVSRMLIGMARVGGTQGNLNEARKQIEEALVLIEKVRVAAGGQQLRASYFASKQDAYKLYMDLLMQQHRLMPARGHDAEALGASERARARSLLEMLNEGHVDIRQGVEAGLLERERNLSQLLNAKAQRQIQLLAQKNTQQEIAALNREVSALEDEYQQVQAAIRKQSPQFSALIRPQPLNLNEIQQQLDQNTLLLEYSIGEERSYVWAVTPKSLKSYELPKRDQIEKAARQVYQRLTNRSLFRSGETTPQRQDRIAQADSQLLDASTELSQMVLGPVAAELGNKRLVVVADGALQYIPFAVLRKPSVAGSQLLVAGSRTTNGRRTRNPRQTTDNIQLTTEKPLIVDHEIISLPSASVLAVQRKGLEGRKPAAKAIAVIADPVFSTADVRLKSIAKTPPDKPDQTEAVSMRLIEHLADDSGKLVIKRLRFTRHEAEQILAVTPRTTNLKAMDFEANRATATGGELSKYRYVHFATHGYLDSERPDLSAIVLSLVDQQGKTQDGFLRAHEIYNLNLPAELVVLSACETGLGKEIKGEGLVGLTRGFMYAGARRVVVSLWNVNDKATAELMQRFYRGMLRENKTPAASLRAAQIEMWQQKQWQSPYYWAAFVLQGEWR